MPKPLLNRVPVEQMGETLQQAWQDSMKLRGDASFFEVFANHAELYRWYTESFYGEVFQGGLVQRRIKELIRLRLSTTHGCKFCNQGNRQDALAAGLSPTDIDALESSDLSNFQPAERAAIGLADEIVLTNPQGRLRADLYQTLRKYYSDAEILEMGLVSGILSGMAKFLFVFDLVEKEDSCPFQSLDPD